MFKNFSLAFAVARLAAQSIVVQATPPQEGFKKPVRLAFPTSPHRDTANMRLPKQEQVGIQNAAELKRLRKQARYAKQYKGD